MRHRRRERGVLSTRQLMGIEQIKDCYIQTAHGDLIFFIIQPTNISVLPQAGIEARILSLLNVLRSQQEVELLAMNSRESFENNKAFYQARMEQETSPKIRELLERDRAHLDEIQVLSTLAREFYMKELTAALNDLYEKHVPADTREYLERKQPPARPRQKPKKPESHPGKERTADATSGEPEQPPG